MIEYIYFQAYLLCIFVVVVVAVLLLAPHSKSRRLIAYGFWGHFTVLFSIQFHKCRNQSQSQRLLSMPQCRLNIAINLIKSIRFVLNTLMLKLMEIRGIRTK